MAPAEKSLLTAVSTSCTPVRSPLRGTGRPALGKHPQGAASVLRPDVILPSMDLRALLGTQASLSPASLCIVVPSSTKRLITVVQSKVGASRCPAGASGARGGWWGTADALGEPPTDGEEAQSPFLGWENLRTTTCNHIWQVPKNRAQL